MRIIPMLLVDREDGTWALYRRTGTGWTVVIKGLRIYSMRV